MNKELKITPPEGYEIDREKSTFEHIVFKEVSKKFPSKWEDLPILKGWYIDSQSSISEVNNGIIKDSNKNIWPTKELAEAALALSQLMQLRQAWIGDWKPDFTSSTSKYVIRVYENKIDLSDYRCTNRVLSFPSAELRGNFFTTFKDLLEIAKPLL